MSDFHEAEVTLSAPQVPQGPAGEMLPDQQNQSADGFKNTAPPPQSNRDPISSNPRSLTTLWAGARHGLQATGVIC
jgi:hypothetical protein